jgi:hypothetical protein
MGWQHPLQENQAMRGPSQPLTPPPQPRREVPGLSSNPLATRPTGPVQHNSQQPLQVQFSNSIETPWHANEEPNGLNGSSGLKADFGPGDVQRSSAPSESVSGPLGRHFELIDAEQFQTEEASEKHIQAIEDENRHSRNSGCVSRRGICPCKV